MILIWLLVSLAFMSLVEYVFHRWPMHSKLFALRSKGLSDDAFESHAVLHHGRFYKEFEGDPDRAAKYVSLELQPGYLLLGLSPAWLPLLFSPLMLLGLTIAAVIVIHGTVWTAIHREMHEPAGRWFARTRLYKFWRAYHKRHHERPGTNFNVILPLWDFIFRTYGGLAD